MTWWGWILEIVGAAMLAAAVALAILNTIKKKPFMQLSLPVTAAASIVAAVLFTLLSPARPPAWLIALSAVAGLAAGVGLSFPARLRAEGGLVTSSHGQLHLAAWSTLMLVSSVLVVCGTGPARASVAIVLFASLGMAGYSTALYLRLRSQKGEGLRSAGAVQPGTG